MAEIDTTVERMKAIAEIFSGMLDAFEKQVKDAALLYTELEDQKTQVSQTLERLNVAVAELSKVPGTVPAALRAELEKQIGGLVDEPRHQMEQITRSLSTAATGAADSVNRIMRKAQALQLKVVAGVFLIAVAVGVCTSVVLWKFQLNASDYEYARLGRMVDRQLKRLPNHERDRVMQILNVR